MKRRKLRTFKVLVRWEAVAIIKVRAVDHYKAEDIAYERGLPWKHAKEGDEDHHHVQAVG